MNIAKLGNMRVKTLIAFYESFSLGMVNTANQNPTIKAAIAPSKSASLCLI